MIGTFDYAAPEQLKEGPIDARTDVYALGGVLFQAITGKVPYPRETAAATMLAHLDSPPPSRAERAARRQRAARRGRPPRDGQGPRGPLPVRRRPRPRRPRRRRGPPRGRRASAASPPATPRRTRTRAPAGPAPARARGRDRPRARSSAAPSTSRSSRPATPRPRPASASSSCSSGEPGIGKTRLATELARRAHREGATVLYGRNDPESLVPYQPFIAALQHYFAHREDLRLPAEITLELSELARFVPALRRHVGDAARLARRRRRDAPLPAVRGRHAACSHFAARERPGGAAARRPALGRPVDDAAARPPAAGRRADAPARARHRAPASRTRCSTRLRRQPSFERIELDRA